MAATPSGKDKITRHMRAFIGSNNVSGDSRTVSTLAYNFSEVDLTGWADDLVQVLGDVITVGIDGYQALMNDAAGRSYNALTAADNDYPVSILFGGGGEPAAGDPSYGIPAVRLGQAASFQGGGAILQSGFVPDPNSFDNFRMPFGHVLKGTSEGNLAAGAIESVDSLTAASTALGFTAHLHIYTADAGADYTVRIEHSANDSTWATLATFTADGSALASEILNGSGTVNRYVRAFVTENTGGTVAAVVTFYRNY